MCVCARARRTGGAWPNLRSTAELGGYAADNSRVRELSATFVEAVPARRLHAMAATDAFPTENELQKHPGRALLDKHLLHPDGHPDATSLVDLDSFTGTVGHRPFPGLDADGQLPQALRYLVIVLTPGFDNVKGGALVYAVKGPQGQIWVIDGWSRIQILRHKRARDRRAAGASNGPGLPPVLIRTRWLKPEVLVDAASEYILVRVV